MKSLGTVSDISYTLILSEHTIHARATTILLDILLAIWALLCHFPDLVHRLVLFLDPVFNPSLVIGTTLAFVPWSVACNARFGAALVAGADVGHRLGLFELRLHVWLLLCFRFGRGGFLFMSLASSAARCETPAPSRSVFGLRKYQ